MPILSAPRAVITNAATGAVSLSIARTDQPSRQLDTRYPYRAPGKRPLSALPKIKHSDKTMTDPAPSVRFPAPALLPVYGAAIFLSAALLFAVQPMFTKMVLPRLGGSPSVWSVAMVFFQAMLLGGY